MAAATHHHRKSKFFFEIFRLENICSHNFLVHREVNRAAFDSCSRNLYNFFWKACKMASLTKRRGKEHLASLPANSVCIETHPKWVLLDLSTHKLKIYGSNFLESKKKNIFFGWVGRRCVRASRCLWENWTKGGKRERKREKHTKKMMGEAKKK